MRYVLYAALLILAFSSVSEAAPGDVLLVRANQVNVRQFPSLEAAVLTRLNRGSSVVEVRREGDWIRIRSKRPDGVQGYVHGSLLRPALPSNVGVDRPPASERILDLTWDVSKKLEQVLREIGQLEDDVSELKHRLIRLESKVDRLRRETGHQPR